MVSSRLASVEGEVVNKYHVMRMLAQNADRINNATPEQIAAAQARLDPKTRKLAEKFEALGQTPATGPTGRKAATLKPPAAYRTQEAPDLPVGALSPNSTIHAIDPGPEQSAYVLFRAPAILDFGKVSNLVMRGAIRGLCWDCMVIEKIASYGMPVGAEVFQTCVESGRFQQIATDAHRPIAWITRLEVKRAICRSAKANDANIRAALIDRWGGDEAAFGRRGSKWKKHERTEGPLAGISKDVWAALAVAVAFMDPDGLMKMEELCTI